MVTKTFGDEDDLHDSESHLLITAKQQRKSNKDSDKTDGKTNKVVPTNSKI